jgi:hypothetical protein
VEEVQVEEAEEDEFDEMAAKYRGGGKFNTFQSASRSTVENKQA